jgi:hypothetical protein
MSGGLGRAGKSQKRAVSKDAVRLSKDSATIRRDIKSNRFMTVAGTVRDMDRTLKLIDQQMEGLEKIKVKNKDNAAIQKTVKTQKAMLRAQKRELKLMRKRNRVGKANKSTARADTSIVNMYPAIDYTERKDR